MPKTKPIPTLKILDTPTKAEFLRDAAIAWSQAHPTANNPVADFLNAVRCLKLPMAENRLVVGFTAGCDGYLSMGLGIPEDVQKKEIETFLPTVLAWRAALIQFQGRSSTRGRNPLLDEIANLKKERKLSYHDIAKNLNSRFEGMVTNYHTWLPIENWECWRKAEQVNAWNLLALFGHRPDAIKEWWDTALENLENGKPVFDYGYEPITRDAVRELLRARKRKEMRNERGYS